MRSDQRSRFERGCWNTNCSGHSSADDAIARGDCHFTHADDCRAPGDCDSAASKSNQAAGNQWGSGNLEDF